MTNNEMLGTELNPSQWSFPLTENQKGVGTLRLDNNRTRSIIDEFDKLIDITVIDNDRKTLWKRCVECLKLAFNIVRKKENYSEK